jgi:carboxypeptidase Taq
VDNTIKGHCSLPLLCPRLGDAPAAWNSAIEASLGVKVPDDRRGILQDPHWLWGQFGGFCSYTIGNVMAAQLYQAATAHGEGIGDALSRGEYEPLKFWLFENIHRHGRRYTRNDLLLKATGRPLDPEPYIAYLRSKYSDLYDLPMS